MTNVLIIENDSIVAQELKMMIEQAGLGFTVCDVIHSVVDARVWLMTNKAPQLIFCDVQLADGLGFDIFSNMPVVAPVIFCTHDGDYAFKAFENYGIDYLLKPLSPEKLRRSLLKFAQLKELFGEENALTKRPASSPVTYRNNYKTSLLVYYQDKIIPISLDKLDFIYYNNYQVSVYAQNARYETRDTLNNIITTLNPKDFFRANRQFIIHRKAVTSIQQYFGRKLLIGIASPTPEPVIISKANATDFLKWVEGMHYQAPLPMLLENARLVN
ncbi:LytR/AlgR family response regulator transcription factor [Dyadobacter sandarakinus]|uniref:Response regulator transcription factor n=1 Tax=Dyadobacter sandarakinus TaxID=2747268 RepID=A0ABX7I2M0_9BACT|nr:LytTR family DNA-binding domain-containing protein [Dyadobacter sandarakinus]QRQ99477.1 response regulator transcription factor [Dyadobacter sandarakinus]